MLDQQRQEESVGQLSSTAASPNVGVKPGKEIAGAISLEILVPQEGFECSPHHVLTFLIRSVAQARGRVRAADPTLIIPEGD